MAFDPEAVRKFERSSWNRIAAGYDTSFAPATTQFIPVVLDAAGIAPGHRVLDVCCGPGRTAASAALRGAEVNGLDFSHAMLDVARRESGAVTFDQGDADAIERHDDPALSGAPPTGPGGVRSVEECITALTEAGFGQVRADTVFQTWRLANGRALVDALRRGTARSGARIGAQPDNAMPAIIADVEKHAAPYRDAEGIAVPMAAILAFGRK